MQVTFCILMFFLAAAAGDKKQPAWQTGTLVDQTVTLEDSGCAGNVCGGTYHRTHYVIEAGSKLYVVNRTGGRLDLTVNQPIKFAIDGNTAYLMDGKGKVHDCHLEQERNVVSAPQGQSKEAPLDLEATVALVSTPAGADVNVDGVFVGNAPATLKLKPGKHNIKLTLRGYKDWSRDMTALAGSQVSLTATLDKEN